MQDLLLTLSFSFYSFDMQPPCSSLPSSATSFIYAPPPSPSSNFVIVLMRSIKIKEKNHSCPATGLDASRHDERGASEAEEECLIC